MLVVVVVVTELWGWRGKDRGARKALPLVLISQEMERGSVQVCNIFHSSSSPRSPPRLLFPLPVLLSPLHTPSRETDMKVMKQYSEGRIEWFSQQFAEALLHPVSRHPGLPREPLTGGSDLDLTCWLSSLASLIG